jgi:hypothetical protein
MPAQQASGQDRPVVSRDYPGISPQLAIGALLAIQIIIGYEWFLSGFTKLYRGGFAAGLGADLKDKSQAASHWYRTFLNDNIIPNAKTFAVLITWTELAVGVILIGISVLWMMRWSRLSDRVRLITFVLVAGASLSAILMAVNFHLASGAHHPWLIPRTGFDESIDLDTILLFCQLAILFFTFRELRSIRRSNRLADHSGADAYRDGVKQHPVTTTVPL